MIRIKYFFFFFLVLNTSDLTYQTKWIPGEILIYEAMIADWVLSNLLLQLSRKVSELLVVFQLKNSNPSLDHGKPHSPYQIKK